MNDLAQMLAAPGLEATAFPPNSRYHGLPVRSYRTVAGHTVKYLAPRISPSPEGMVRIATHTVAAGDRPDILANDYFGDAVVSWRVGDSNTERWLSDLVARPGRRLSVALPANGG